MPPLPLSYEPEVENSIYHWIMISHGLEAEDGRNNCALCNHYSEYDDGEYLCIDSDEITCPIFHVMGLTGCIGTPYTTWLKHGFSHVDNRNHDEWHIKCNKCKIIALTEVGFINYVGQETA